MLSATEMAKQLEQAAARAVEDAHASQLAFAAGPEQFLEHLRRKTDAVVERINQQVKQADGDTDSATRFPESFTGPFASATEWPGPSKARSDIGGDDNTEK